jgi:hypothetical protein
VLGDGVHRAMRQAGYMPTTSWLHRPFRSQPGPAIPAGLGRRARRRGPGSASRLRRTAGRLLEASGVFTPDSLQVQPSRSPTRFSGASTCSQNLAPSSRMASTMSGLRPASRQALIVRFIAEQFVTNEANITQGGLVVVA